MHKLITAMIAVVLSVSLPVSADQIAVSADGSAVISSIGRVLYQHDPQTLEVTKRMRFDQEIEVIATSNDGKRFYVGHGVFDLTLDVVDSATGKRLSRIEDVQSPRDKTPSGALAASIESGRLAVRTETGVVVLDLASGQTLAEIELKQLDAEPFAMAFSPDGKTIVEISRQHDNDEAKEDGWVSHDTPLEETTKLVKADGKGATMRVIDVQAKQVKQTLPLFYAPDLFSGTSIGFSGNDRLTVLTYNNVNAHIGLDGTIELFRLKELAYGSGVTHGGQRFYTGSMIHSGHAYNATGEVLAEIKAAEANPGWPEYFETFAFTKDGTAYGLTSAQRIFKLNDEHAMSVVKPVY